MNKLERLESKLSTAQPVGGWVKPSPGQRAYFHTRRGSVLSGELIDRATRERYGGKGVDPWWVMVGPNDIRAVARYKSGERIEIDHSGTVRPALSSEAMA